MNKLNPRPITYNQMAAFARGEIRPGFRDGFKSGFISTVALPGTKIEEALAQRSQRNVGKRASEALQIGADLGCLTYTVPAALIIGSATGVMAKRAFRA